MKLKTLGELRLEPSLFTQPKPLLLLAYLALEGPQQRRHLAELFWQRGNRMKSLSMTLTRLRQGAGEVVKRDDKRVWSTLKSDAKALLEALDKRDWQKASELYSGAFLEGVVQGDWSSELEEWVYATREYLAERVQHALLTLAKGAAKGQDFKAAATFAERAYKLPGLGGSEVVTLKRLYTLLCAGNSLLAPEVRKEAEGYGVTLKLSSEKARARFKPEKAVTTTLPMRGTSFVGRDVELTELATLLSRTKISLLSLLGPAGVGKTRLALQIAHEQLKLGAFAGGVHFIPLDALSDPGLIPSSLIGHLGLAQQATSEPLEQLIDFIGERRMLLVLDNFEHLGEGSSFLPPLLSRCPNLKLLVTSRETLRLEEEYIFAVEGLPYPKTPSEDAILRDAVQLFKERAERAQPHFDLGRELPDVIAICQLVEGLPLGIELSAAWVRLMSCADIAGEIRKSLEFLSSTTKNIPERHHSLKAAFESSWKRLSQKEQDVLKRLSVFRGGFRREAASEVAGATIPMLASLVDKSLLRVLPNGRYDRHSLLYQFTQEKLAERPDEQTQIETKHTDFYLGFAEEAEPRLQGKEQVRWFGRLSEEMDNFREAFRNLEAKGATETALRLATALGYFWGTQGYYTEGYEYLTMFLPKTSSHSVTEAKALFLAGDLAWVQSDHETAQTLLEQSLAIAKDLGEKSLWAKSLRALGLIAQVNRGDPEGARSCYESALELAKESKDKAAAAAILRSLGTLNNEGANYQRARLYYEESAALSDALGDDHSRAKALVSLATVLSYLGEFAEAHSLNEQCLELFRAVGDTHGEGISLLNLGVDAAQRGDIPQEIERYQGSLELFRRLGDKRMVSHLLNNLAGSLQKRGDASEARELLEESLTIQGAVGDVSLASHALNLLGSVFVDQGKPEEAYGCYQECLRLCRKTGDNWMMMRVLEALARWHLDRRDYQTAQPLLTEAVELAHTSGDQKTLAKALEAQAKLEAGAGEGARAVQLLACAEMMRQRLGFARMPRYQGDYEDLLARLRESLREKPFKNAWLRGQTVALEEALRMCRDLADRPSSKKASKASSVRS
jgi:predicted ATPase/uncharacterized protein HemY